jgi:hypothetical protein
MHETSALDERYAMSDFAISVAKAAKSAAMSVVAAFAALLLTPAPAGAIYTYTYIPVFPLPAGHSGTLTVTDAAVTSGSLFYFQQTSCFPRSGPCDTFGDPTGLVNLSYGLPSGFHFDSITPPNNIGTLVQVRITFNPDGTLTGTVNGLDGIFDNDFKTGGAEFSWDGFWNNSGNAACPDSLWRGESFGCYDPGYWYTSQALPDAVAEPSSLSLLFGGALAFGLALWLSRRKARPIIAVDRCRQ